MGIGYHITPLPGFHQPGSKSHGTGVGVGGHTGEIEGLHR
jgi:hypothetical protein